MPHQAAVAMDRDAWVVIESWVRISTVEHLLDLLDALTPQRSDATSSAASDSWAEILTRPGHPLNTDLPDVNLLAWSRAGLLSTDDGRQAVDVGCGLGRNTRWLAHNGWKVLGIDISQPAIAEATRRQAGGNAQFVVSDFLREPLPVSGRIDFAYDSGCFHHLAPHRRISYLAALLRALTPGGLFGICTFTAGHMGSELADAELLISGRFGDGIGYAVDELVAVFDELELIDAAPQTDYAAPEPAFIQSFLTAALFRRPA